MTAPRRARLGDAIAFDVRAWAFLGVVWTVLDFVCARAIYPLSGLGFWLCFLAAQARALLAGCLALLLAHILGRRFGAWGRRLPEAALLLLTLLCAAGAAAFAWSGATPGLVLRTLLGSGVVGLWTVLLDLGVPVRVQLAGAAAWLAAVAGGLWLQERRRRAAAGLKTRLAAAVPLILAVAAALAIVAEQAASVRLKNPRDWRREQSAMPLYAALWSPRGLAEFDVVVAPFRRDDLAAAAKQAPFDKPRPIGPVVLVVLESVRADAIDAATAPNLDRFRAESVRFRDAYANGNGTVLSWYAIFDAHFPYYALSARTAPDWAGSPPLRILRDAGFRTDVYSAPNLAFFDYRRVAFGPPGQLAAIHQSGQELSVPERDRAATRGLLAALSAAHGAKRRVYALLLDSTHSLYSWPADFPAKFAPYADDTGVAVAGREFAERLRNRYKNALRYDDALFGEVVAKLKASGQYRDALIVVVADHGEEFLEHGGFIHGTTLYNELVRVPLYLKIPGVAAGERPGPAAQIDILPTVLDALGLSRSAAGLTDGRSLLSAPEGPALTMALPDAARPDRGLLSTGRYQIEFRLAPGGATGTRLTVWDVRDRQDRSVAPPQVGPAGLSSFLDDEFVPALNRTGLLRASAR